MTPPYKGCPRCQTLAASRCEHCSHVYRTQFVPPPDQTQYYGVAPPTQQVPPPQPQPHGPQFGHYPPRADRIQLYPGTHAIAAAIICAVLIGHWCGALVNRQYIKGVVILVITIVLNVLTGCRAMLVLYPIGIIDTITVAQRINRGEPVGQWQFF